MIDDGWMDGYITSWSMDGKEELTMDAICLPNLGCPPPPSTTHSSPPPRGESIVAFLTTIIIHAHAHTYGGCYEPCDATTMANHETNTIHP